MEENARLRNLPIGIQDFEDLRTNNYLYVDKTALIYRLVTTGKYYFLSRPRRFGKSLLMSTIHAYFSGKKELFRGLAMEGLEKDWLEYPVLHLDLNTRNYSNSNALLYELNKHLEYWEAQYGNKYRCRSIEERFTQIIKLAYEKTGRKVVILVDEYDKPVLQAIGNEALQEEYRVTLKGFYGALKTMDGCIRFALLTGVTKFGKLSVFSDLNNLNDISLNLQYHDICGITADEMKRDCSEYIKQLALEQELSLEQTFEKLRMMYDGYHFHQKGTGIYNPFSLLNCLYRNELGSYWFSTGTPSFLLEKMREFRTDILKLNRTEFMPASAFESSIQEMDSALPLLYQSGYLTIKDYDKDAGSYALGIPNEEVRVGLFENLLKRLTPLNTDQRMNMVAAMNRALRRGDVDAAMKALQSFLAGVPYMYEGKEVLEDLEKLEALHQRDLYILFNGMGLNLETEVKQAKGRVDMVVWLPDAIYIFEFKMRGTASSALAQIEKNLYDAPYMADPRPKVKVGVRFTCAKHTITSWKIAR